MRTHGGGGVLETMRRWAVAHVGVDPLPIYIGLCGELSLGYQDEHHNGRMLDETMHTSRDSSKLLRGHVGHLRDGWDWHWVKKVQLQR